MSRPIHYAHATASELGDDFIIAQKLIEPRQRQGHVERSLVAELVGPAHVVAQRRLLRIALHQSGTAFANVQVRGDVLFLRRADLGVVQEPFERLRLRTHF